MLRTAEEIQLLSTALEPGIRNPLRVEHGPDEILRDFFADMNLAGQRVLELGPGHYEFCEAIRRRGVAAEVVELDPPVIELGRRRGFKVWPGNLTQLPSLPITPGFDGLFCKGSNNPFWFYGQEAALRHYIETMANLVRLGGWLWVVSCPYREPALPPEEFSRWLDLEAAIYRELGFREWVPPHRLNAACYGISFDHSRLAVFTKGLPPHRWSPATLALLPWFAARVAVRRAGRLFDR